MLDRYRGVLGAPHVLALVLASMLARLPLGIGTLATLLFVRQQTGSFAVAGLVQGAWSVGSGLVAPVQGRLVDRLGQARVLVPSALVATAGVVALVVAGVARAPVAALVVAAFVAGGATPPVSAALRSLWPSLLAQRPGLLGAAFALDSILVELIFIAGPLLTAVLIALVSPQAALLLGAGVALAGTVWFATRPASTAWRGEAARRGWAGALASPGMRTLVLTCLPLGACVGSLEVALPAFGVEHGSGALGGPLIAMWSLGSAAGGLAYGALAERTHRWRGDFVAFSVLLPVTSAVPLAAPSVGAMLAIVPVAGLGIAPMVSARNQLVGGVTPAGTVTEGYTWVLMAMIVGIAGGTALGGALVDAHGWRAAVLAGCGLGLLGAVASFARRATLAPATA